MDDLSMTMDTLAVHAGREDLTALGLHALPIDLSTTNPLPNIEKGGDSYEALATGGTPIDGGSNVYARLWNPTVARFESGLAQLEHAESAVAFASGMAALSAAILAFTASTHKRHVVAVRPLYGGTDHLLATGLLGTEVTFCDADNSYAAHDFPTFAGPSSRIVGHAARPVGCRVLNAMSVSLVRFGTPSVRLTCDSDVLVHGPPVRIMSPGSRVVTCDR